MGSVASVQTTTEMINEFSGIFTGIGCFKWNFSLKVKEMLSPDRHSQDVWHTHFRNPSKGSQKDYKNNS